MQHTPNDVQMCTRTHGNVMSGQSRVMTPFPSVFCTLKGCVIAYYLGTSKWDVNIKTHFYWPRCILCVNSHLHVSTYISPLCICGQLFHTPLPEESHLKYLLYFSYAISWHSVLPTHPRWIITNLTTDHLNALLNQRTSFWLQKLKLLVGVKTERDRQADTHTHHLRDGGMLVV